MASVDVAAAHASMIDGAWAMWCDMKARLESVGSMRWAVGIAACHSCGLGASSVAIWLKPFYLKSVWCSRGSLKWLVARRLVSSELRVHVRCSVRGENRRHPL